MVRPGTMEKNIVSHMKTNAEDAVSPIVVPLAMDPRIEQGGLTKREYFAALAMQGLLLNVAYARPSEENARYAVEQADMLIAELNKEPKGE